MRKTQRQILEEMPQCYLERERGYGNGIVRIGEYLELEEDIYSLGFVSQISNQLIEKHFDVIKGDLIDETNEVSAINADDMIVESVKCRHC